MWGGANMTRTYLQCDLCGDKWDVTDTDYYKNSVYPGLQYVKDCVSTGRRQFIIQKVNFTTDERLERDDLDICDRCYNAIDRFLFSLGKEEEDGSESTL